MVEPSSKPTLPGVDMLWFGFTHTCVDKAPGTTAAGSGAGSVGAGGGVSSAVVPIGFDRVGFDRVGFDCVGPARPNFTG